MSELKLIKEHLLNNQEGIEKLLESIGCEHVKTEQGGNLITCQLPKDKFDSLNRRAVQIKLNDNLTSNIRNRADFQSSDIFDLISYIHFDKRSEDIKKNLYESKVYICKMCGLDKFINNGDFREIDEDLKWLSKIKKKRSRKVEIKTNPILSETVLDEYLPYPYYGWIEEGISYETQKMYGVGFDLESKRITIPMRNRQGQLVGVKGRIMKDKDDDRKYIYLYPFNNRYEWFNFHYAHPYILSEKVVYIFEAEKSSMKAFDFGIYNTLSIGASEISIEQAQIVKQLGMDIKIVLCYDKGIDLDDIQRVAKLFNGRELYVMYDSGDVLKHKNSPIDEGLDKWNEMLEDYTFKLKQEEE